jgi:hypothetical protein
MNVKMQHRIKTASVLLAIAVLTAGQMPTATALGSRQELPAARVLQGSGVFPRLAVAAPAADGMTLALYLVEGDTATQLATLEGTHAGVNRAIVQLSPDGRYVVCLRTEGDYLRPILEVIDTQAAQRAIIAEGAKDVPEQGATSETLTSVAWVDAEHILYSKVQWPGNEEWTTSWEAGTPLPVRGEVWLSDVEGQEQRLLASGSIYRALGASPGGNTLYVTRLIPGREAEREEGFALLDLESGEMRNLWPRGERGAERYHSFKMIALPDGTQRLLFATAQRVDTAPTQPPVIWIADPESGHAEAIATINQGRAVPEYGTAIYDIPRDFLWSPRSEREFIYLADGAALGGAWRVDLDAEMSEPLGGTESLARTGLRLLAWTPEGIVIQTQDGIRLLDENDEVQGEMRFHEGEERALAPAEVLSTVVDWNVPYIHQIDDTPDWFDGDWACGPTSAVMALAYYKRLAPRAEGYGWYVPNQYTQQSACSGVNTFDRMQYDAATPPHEARGAYGACTNNGFADRGMIQDYVRKHDVGSYNYGSPPTEADVQTELRGGAVVLLGTDFTASGHDVIVRGYTNDNPVRYIVNDPAGDWHAGYYNANGNGVQYTWAEMSPNWYIALYGPQYLPDLSKPAYSADGSTIIVHNGAPAGWLADNVKVCLMNSNGSPNTTRTASVPANGIWSLSLYSVFGYGSFSGSAVVMRNQTAGSVVVESQTSNPAQAYAYNGVMAAGGEPMFRLGRTIYTPLSIARYSNWHTLITIQNTSPLTASVSITYREPAGNSRGTFPNPNNPIPNPIPPNGSVAVDANVHLGSSFTGSAVVASDQDIAVVVRETNGSMTGGYNGAGAGSTTVHVPLVLKGYSDWTTGFQIQNVDPWGATVTITYYNSNGGVAGTQQVYIPGNGNLWVVPSVVGPWSGVAVVSSDRNLAVEVDEYNAGTGDLQSYNGLAWATGTAYLPDVRSSGTWYSGLVIQNTSTAWSQVRLSVNGAEMWTQWIEPHGWRSTGVNGSGSAMVQSLNGQWLVVEVDNYWAAGGDMLMSYMGINR